MDAFILIVFHKKSKSLSKLSTVFGSNNFLVSLMVRFEFDCNCVVLYIWRYWGMMQNKQKHSFNLGRMTSYLIRCFSCSGLFLCIKRKISSCSWQVMIFNHFCCGCCDSLLVLYCNLYTVKIYPTHFSPLLTHWST